MLIYAACFNSSVFLKLPFRIIIHGKELISGIVSESAKPFNFKQEFGLSEEKVRLEA